MKGYTKFKVFLVENNIKQKDIAELLNNTVNTVSSKINKSNGYRFSLDDIKILCDTYNLNPDMFI
ncbi:helix-turn-helix domain-containing protein [Oceanivirga salmonicida]|uniref:helix-turn-helix domain-containing protein n=1 Tax=Oceanivirga salmonicida TaxID=1769291 RepID=UPI000835999A|nr:helix-turn-helix transcriptional regulator [Oceanivirga salmonicida]